MSSSNLTGFRTLLQNQSHLTLSPLYLGTHLFPAFSCTVWSLEMGLTCCLTIWINNYEPMLCTMPEDWRPQNSMHLQPFCGLIHNHYQHTLLTSTNSNTIGRLRIGMLYFCICVLQDITYYVLCAMPYCITVLCTKTCCWVMTYHLQVLNRMTLV